MLFCTDVEKKKQTLDIQKPKTRMDLRTDLKASPMCTHLSGNISF